MESWDVGCTRSHGSEARAWGHVAHRCRFSLVSQLVFSCWEGEWYHTHIPLSQPPVFSSNLAFKIPIFLFIGYGKCLCNKTEITWLVRPILQSHQLVLLHFHEDCPSSCSFFNLGPNRNHQANPRMTQMTDST